MSDTSAALPNDSELGSIAIAHLRRLAGQPRPTSSAEAADARQYCTHALTACGFRVRELPFEYSAAVGAYGTSVGGLVALLLIAAAALCSLGERWLVALSLLVLGSAALALGGQFLARHGVLVLPLMRRRGVNLEACRDGDEPALWLVAHVDSKSQPVPLLVRAAGIVLLGVTWLAAAMVAIRSALGHPSAHAWSYIGIAALLGALPVVASLVGRRSPGAIDNASGVAAVLGAASALPPDVAVGVLITDAEELGLAGARAWCEETHRPSVPVLNCDGIDDDGQLTLMWTRPRAPDLERVMRDATEGLGERLRIIPLVPGVLVDGVAFADAGWPTVTLSRGSLATLRRIHTRGDNLEHLQGRGIANAALVLARAALTLTERR